MSLHRVLQRLEREAAEHERGTRDGYEPMAQAHREFLGALNEDIGEVRRAIADREGRPSELESAAEWLSTAQGDWSVSAAAPRGACWIAENRRRGFDPTAAGAILAAARSLGWAP